MKIPVLILAMLVLAPAAFATPSAIEAEVCLENEIAGAKQTTFCLAEGAPGRKTAFWVQQPGSTDRRYFVIAEANIYSSAREGDDDYRLVLQGVHSQTLESDLSDPVEITGRLYEDLMGESYFTVQTQSIGGAPFRATSYTANEFIRTVHRAEWNLIAGKK